MKDRDHQWQERNDPGSATTTTTTTRSHMPGASHNSRSSGTSQRVRSTGALLAALCWTAGCAPSAPTGPTTPAAPSPGGQEADPEDDLSQDEADLLAQIETEAALAESESMQADGGDTPEGREIIYRVSPDGMRVLIGDAEFIPYAVAVRTAGGWGLRLTVDAKTTSQMVLFAPTQGPLAFGGVVKRPEPDKFSDKREGGSEVILAPGEPVSFSRSWPPPGQPGLRAGEELELHVGLWGLGTSSEDRRPINRFAVVKMTASASGAKPIVQPPQ